MSDLTPELSLFTAVDDDDTADYLTLSLKDSLQIIDGLFSSATGHRHNGSHQGGALSFDNLVVGGSLTVSGPLSVTGTLNVTGLATFQNGISTPYGALTYTTYSHLAANQYDVGANVSMVFVGTAGASVRLPAATASAQRPPITVSPGLNITTTVTAVDGAVFGGSINASGVIVNGSIVSGATAPDAISYKSDGSNWRAI